MDLGLLLLRMVIGLTLAAHGVQKLFGWFGGHGLDGTGALLEQMGFVPGRRHAFMAGFLEAAAGLLLAAGLLTPLASALILAVMVVAAMTAHSRGGFFLTSGGYEYNVVIAATAISVAFTGAGAWSLDALLGLPSGGPLPGLAAIVVGAIGSAGSLLTRQHVEARS